MQLRVLHGVREDALREEAGGEAGAHEVHHAHGEQLPDDPLARADGDDGGIRGRETSAAQTDAPRP